MLVLSSRGSSWFPVHAELQQLAKNHYAHSYELSS